jgi:hypothetical protein
LNSSLRIGTTIKKPGVSFYARRAYTLRPTNWWRRPDAINAPGGRIRITPTQNSGDFSATITESCREFTLVLALK